MRGSFQRSALAERQEEGAETKKKWRCPRQPQADPLPVGVLKYGLVHSGFLVWAFNLACEPKSLRLFSREEIFSFRRFYQFVTC